MEIASSQGSARAARNQKKIEGEKPQLLRSIKKALRGKFHRMEGLGKVVKGMQFFPWIGGLKREGRTKTGLIK